MSLALRKVSGIFRGDRPTRHERLWSAESRRTVDSTPKSSGSATSIVTGIPDGGSSTRPIPVASRRDTLRRDPLREVPSSRDGKTTRPCESASSPPRSALGDGDLFPSVLGEGKVGDGEIGLERIRGDGHDGVRVASAVIRAEPRVFPCSAPRPLIVARSVMMGGCNARG